MAIVLTFEPDGLTQLVVWKDRPSLLRSIGEVKRLRDLKRGDVVDVGGERMVVRSVGVFR